VRAPTTMYTAMTGKRSSPSARGRQQPQPLT
jgi:hypothetical protein